MLYRNLFIALLVTGSLAYTSQASFAQTLNEEQVTVIAPYSPTITKAQKMGDVPTNMVNTNSKFKLEYYTNPQLISTTFELKELQAARYISSKDPKYKQNMIYAGVGLYTSPYAELFLNGKIKKDLTLGIHATHFSSKASVKDYAYSGFSKSGAEVWAKKTGAKKVFWFSGFYQRDLFHYYGFNPDDYLSSFVAIPDFDEESKQLFTDFGGKFNLSSTISKKKSGFVVDGGYRYFTDLYKNNENVINLDAIYTRPIDFLGFKNQYGGIRLLSEVAITHWADFTQMQNVSLINITAPILTQNFFHGKADFQLYYNILFDRFDLKVGGIVSAGLDSTSTFRVYPDVNLKADLIKNVLDLFLQLDGGLVSPSYYSLSRENPYISAFLPLNYSSINYRFKGGFNINIVGRADIQLYGSLEKIDNDLFFTTDTVGFYRNQMNLIYDDTEVVKIGGDISVMVSDDIQIALDLAYQKYTMNLEPEAWYKPTWKGQFSVDYYLYDNLKLNLLVKGQSKVWAKEGATVHQLDAWFDLGLGGKYSINKNFNAFVNLNNLLSKNYQIWYNHPVKGFGAMAGVSYAF